MKSIQVALTILVLAIPALATAQVPPLFAVESGTSTIHKLDPFSGQILDSFATPVPSHVPVSGGGDGLAFDGTTLYFTSGFASEIGGAFTSATNRTIFYINPETGSSFDSFELPPASGAADLDQAIDALASDGGFVYANRPSDKVILKIDPLSKTVVSTIQVGFDEVGGMGYNPYDGHLYVSDSSGERIHRLDPATGASTGVFTPPGPGGILGIDFVQNKMFVNVGQDILELSPFDGRIINSIPSPFPLPSHIGALAGEPASGWTCDSEVLYTVDSGHSAISVLDPNSGQILQRFLTPVATQPTGPPPAAGGPEALAFDGAQLRYISPNHPTKGGVIYSVDHCTGAVLQELVPAWPSGRDPGIGALTSGSVNGAPTLFALREAPPEILSIDAGSGAITRTISVPGPALSGLGFSSTRGSFFSTVLGASPALLVELDPDSGNTISTRVLGELGPLQVDFVGERLFAASTRIPATIRELNTAGSVVASFPSPGNQPSALAGPSSPPAPESTASVTFRVDMTALELAQMVLPADEIQVRGDFNNWDCQDQSCQMHSEGGSTFSTTIPITAPIGSPIRYRFFVALDPDRFGGSPPPGWEEPTSTGGGDRVVQFLGTDQELPVLPFGDLLPANVIPGGTSSTVTFSLDMSGASDFNEVSDRVFLNLGQEVFWGVSQGLDRDQRFEMADPDGDGVYVGDFQVSGPTTAAIQYRYGWGTDMANPASEEAGAEGGDPGRRRTRWIVRGPSGWPALFALPRDFYQAIGPLQIDQNPATGGPATPPPTAVDDFVTTDQDLPVEIDVLANDIDAFGGGLTIADVAFPSAGGTLSDPGNGSILFTPDAGFIGTVTFSYTAADAIGQTDQANVTVEVREVNEPPIAVNDARSAFEGASTAFDVLSNDSDPNGDLVRLLSVENGAFGLTEIIGDRVRYSATTGAMGTDSFTYTIGDGQGGTATGTVTVQIRPLPADEDGVAQATEAAAPNNGDGNGDGVPDSQQANVASLPSATSGQYITVAAETGSELVGVNSSATSPAPANQPPPSEAAFPAGFLDFQIGGGSGNRALTLELTFDPSEGINAYYKYGPTPDNLSPHWYRFDFDGETGAVFNGNTVTLHFVDGKRGDDDLTENGIIVDPGAPGVVPNKAPQAAPDAAGVDEDNGVFIDVLANDFDGDGDTLTIAQVTQPTNGTVTLVNGVITYTPNPDFFGSDTFSYLVSDGNGGTVSAVVTVTINPINDAPRFTTTGSIFSLPLEGSEVIIGGDSFEMPGDATDPFIVQYGAAFDVEDNPITYKWVLGTDEDVTEPILQADTEETELSFLVSEVAEVLDGSGVTEGTGVTVYHRVIASDGLLETASAVSSFIIVRGFVTAVQDASLPTDFELYQNYPNPFNPITNIRFALPQAGSVAIEVFDALGRRVGMLVDGTMPAGYHQISFDATDLPSGVYLYSMRAGGFSANKPFVLIK